MLTRKCMIVCTLNMLCVFAALAQSKNISMRGRVNDIYNQPVIAASVYLLNATDSTVIKFTITDKNGIYVFSNIKTGTYLVNVTGTGYTSKVSTKISLAGVTDVDIGIIQLKNRTTGLKEVSVSGGQNFIEMKADKTILNIQKSNLSVGNNALEVLRKAPGVQVDNDDNISLYGRSDVLVMIDNKSTYLSGSALTDLLRGTQSNMIDKIELISNPNSTYDAAGTGGIINIRMVRDKTVGLNLQLTGGVGVVQFPGNPYSGYKQNLGLNFNYRNKRLNIFGGYTYSNTPAYKSIITNHLDSYLGQTDIIDVNLFINQVRQTHNLRIGADYNISAKQTIGFLISDVITNQNGPQNTTSIVSNNNVSDSSILTNSTLKRSQSNVSYNLNYQATISKDSKLALNADYIQFDRQYDELFQSNYYYSYNTTPYKNFVLHNNSPLNCNGYVLSGSYHLDVNKNNNLTVGFKASKTKIDNNSSFGSIANSIYTPNLSFTGDFEYSEHINAAYFDYNHMFNKNTGLELGARLEHTTSESITTPSSGVVDDYPNHYYGFFPNIKLNHTINSNNQLQLGYGRRINRPFYNDLNTTVLYNDQYTYQIGNQYLKPSYSNLIEVKHLYKDKFITTVSFEAIDGFSQVVYIESDNTQISTLRKINLGNRYNYTLNFLAPLTISKWYGVDLNLDFKYQQFTGSSASGDLNSGSPDATFLITQHFKLPLNIQADLTGFYEVPTTWGIYRFKAQYYAYGSLSKSVLKKKGSIYLKVDDTFNSNKNVFTSHYQNLNLSAIQINNCRTITLSFSYALGKQTIKAATRKTTDAEEEQNRMIQGGN